MLGGLTALMDAPDEVCAPVNLGNPAEFTILELARIVIAALKSPSRVRFVDLPVDDPKQRKPDISRAMQVLGWSPKVSLADGLARTIPYFAACARQDDQSLLAAE